MSTVGQREILTQQRVVAFFRDALGYAYLGHWQDRPDNGNVEEAQLTNWLARQGHSDKIIGKVLHELGKAAALGGSKTLYDANREVYGLLRYGVKVRPEVGEQNITVWLIDWANPASNDFAIAEEVTVSGENTKRPDLVLYVNGIALGVLELKRSTVSVAEGIRQNLDSQKKTFIRPFYATVQLVMAGNDTEGLRYGVIETPEKYWLRWREHGAPSDIMAAAGENALLRELGQLCGKARLLEIVHDFIVFDAGIKKTCRHNQYFGVRAAQQAVARREGGIIWHTQGSGKSLTMVWLAKWIRENVANSRVLIITDRTELDQQIETVFKGVSEAIYRTKSGADLVQVLNASEEWLIGSLIHKFGAGDEIGDKDIEAFVAEIKQSLPRGFHAKGEVFVFVDECHRTQSGKLHDAMKALLPGAMTIGFTGTPLLKSDKRRSIETFGPYIHTYKYDEAVRDGVVLDLRYEARDIDQNITSQAKIDQWFELKTQGLTDVAKAQLKQRWGTMQKVLSSRDRLEQIVADILMDMATRDRLQSGHGNAMLVSGSIYSACRFFELFQQTDLAGKCAIVTSYQPSPADIKGEETGEGLTEKLRQYDIYRKMLAAHFDEPEDTAMVKVERFEQEVKKRFIDQPGQMKLLIVVDKLLTGFDAPPATYLYIDKQMQDHGLFQAICRVNRLDGEDKEYGYIIDYKDLFRSLEGAIKDYTGEAFAGFDAADVEGLLKDRLSQGRERLEEAREAIKALCEPVAPPRDTTAYVRYFCAAESGNAQQLKDNEPRRVALYKLAAVFLRAYANLANEMREAGYSEAETQVIKAEVSHYEKVREEVKLASGDYIDMKLYEPAMRHLLDTYIRAEESEKLSAFDDLTLVQLIVERGETAVESLPKGLREDREAMAETIENNVRRLIIDEMAVNPKYYEKMSELLDALIAQRRQAAVEYKAYLARIVELTKQVSQPQSQAYPVPINSPARRALYDNLKGVQGLEERVRQHDQMADSAADAAEIAALAVDNAIRRVKKADWRGNRFKEREVRNAIKAELGGDDALVDAMFQIVKAQRDY
ncbi:type I restriction endonuclease subunit R [Immundisolibacter cernigliae]|uniref:Type I restriction enzyme endonuclease subunit n=1 Tax=Immundisolibacter cernigliae TaxID=1810504 RepID=A0A1B1YU42_9GAMM|nr:HsdR family type I site-specific deoxyribonuclease [Immundisolibacter cernigliae]ANX04295.1 restriction endonuclease subunit R [Immundisolibacter cernigliae]